MGLITHTNQGSVFEKHLICNTLDTNNGILQIYREIDECLLLDWYYFVLM